MMLRDFSYSGLTFNLKKAWKVFAFQQQWTAGLTNNLLFMIFSSEHSNLTSANSRQHK